MAESAVQAMAEQDNIRYEAVLNAALRLALQHPPGTPMVPDSIVEYERAVAACHERGCALTREPGHTPGWWKFTHVSPGGRTMGIARDEGEWVLLRLCLERQHMLDDGFDTAAYRQWLREHRGV